MNDKLRQIIETKKQEVERLKASDTLETLQQRCRDAEPARNFFAAVTKPENTLHVIAEIKKASPSAGLIRPDFDPVDIATAYEANGASAISCLTDEVYFQGHLSYISRIKSAVSLPVLRKDFIIDPLQIYEARAAGADAVLLIAECLTEPQLIDFQILISELGMTALVEVHDLESLIQVRDHLNLPRRSTMLLGINNRDLRTMTTDIRHTTRLLSEVPDRRVLVSESGIRSHQDVLTLAEHHVHRILVGEHLCRQPDPGRALHELIHG